MPRLRTFDRPSKRVLARLYRTKTDNEIGTHFGCSRSVAKTWRRDYGIKGIRRHGEGIGGPRKFVRPSIDELQSMTDVLTDQEIADRYGCSRKAISKWRKFYNLQKTTTVYRRRPWAFDLDEDFFEKINTEKKAYILGLLATDGCVCNNKSHSNRVTLSLQARDEHILHEVLDAMRSNAPVHNRPKGNFPGSGPMKYISLTSRKLVTDLAKWGVIPRKSLVLTYTANIPKHLERHYVRGLFEGDGSIHFKDKKIFSFLGTEALIDGIVDAVHRHTGVCLKKREVGRQFRVSGYAGSVDVLHWMYRNSTIFLCRKKAIFETWV